MSADNQALLSGAIRFLQQLLKAIAGRMSREHDLKEPMLGTSSKA